MPCHFPPKSECAQRRRPRRPPFRLVESDGVGVTSSIRPMRMPARASARRADWAPGPGVLVPLPPVALILTWRAEMPSSLQRAAIGVSGVSIKLCMWCGLRTDVLGRQHGSVWRRLVTVGLDLHATGDTGDGFAARQIGDVDEGVVEGRENAGNAEDELALDAVSVRSGGGRLALLTSRTWGPSWMFSCAPRSTFFLGGMLTVNSCLTGADSWCCRAGAARTFRAPFSLVRDKRCPAPAR
jgi:hypothetical protein